MYERRDGLESTVPNETAAYRDRVIRWVKEARRSVDYLETRPEIDVDRLAFFGHSWGGRLSVIALAADRRFKAAVVYVAGLRFPRSMPEVDPFNFVPRVRIPVIMLNGRYDYYFPSKPLTAHVRLARNTRRGQEVGRVRRRPLRARDQLVRKRSPGWTATWVS